MWIDLWCDCSYIARRGRLPVAVLVTHSPSEPSSFTLPPPLRFPSFDGVGNHDGGNSTDPKFGLVRQEVIARNKRRDPAKAGITNYSLSANSLHYSWDWDGAAAAENVAKDGGGQEGGLHMAMLNVYPGTDGDCASGTGIAGTGCSGAPWGWHSPEHSLEFLIQDLAKLQPKNKPTILFMHYGMKGFGSPGTVPWGGYSPDFWWSAREATAFAKAIAPYNIVAIVHGHTHACVFYNWNVTAITGKVYPVFNAPALQKGGPNDPQTTPSQFLTFEVDPAEGDLRVYQRVGAAWGTVKYEGKFAGGGGGSDESTGGSSGAGVGVAAAGRPEVPAVVGTTSVIAEEPPVVHLSVTV